ncbi:nitroreductase family protein [Halopseudomonas pachastrellae]|nr:nitroreductase family protein [Halopseudomonas pachastrellae]
MKGRAAYNRSLRYGGKINSLLRRNIHRLEKGLIMKPRKNVFAESFILETVDSLTLALKNPEIQTDEIKWATDVLNEYFSAVQMTPIIKEARDKFIFIDRKELQLTEVYSILPSPNSKFSPYQHQSLSKAKMDFDALKSLIVRRRSVRWYKEISVPPELVMQAANYASLAPSACNRQPYRFLFCNNKERARDIAKCAGGTSGFADNLQSIIVVLGDLSAYQFERDRHLIYIDASLGSMQLILCLESLGLSSCSINWPEVEASEKRIRSIINLKDHERVIMLLAVGYADPEGQVPFSQKKINESILEDISI